MADDSGVLFDIDGTLLDSTYHHALAWARAFRRHEYSEVTVAQVHRAIGLGDDQLVPHLIGHSNDAVADAHSDEYAALQDEVQAIAGLGTAVAPLSPGGSAGGAGHQRKGQGSGLDVAADRGRGERCRVRDL